MRGGLANLGEGANLAHLMTDACPTAAINAYAARLRAQRLSPAALPADLAALEAEAIHILRETAACFARPVLLYSIGKDSTVLLHLALKAFYPAAPPLALLHIDSGWEFAAMATFRDTLMAALGLTITVYHNATGRAEGINPFTHGSAVFTDVMRTQALLAALREGAHDAAIVVAGPT